MPDTEKTTTAHAAPYATPFSVHDFCAVRLLLEFRSAYARMPGVKDDWPPEYLSTINDLLYSLEAGVVGDMFQLLDSRNLSPAFWEGQCPRRKPRISLSVDLVDGDDLSIGWHNTHFDLKRQRLLPSDWEEDPSSQPRVLGRPGNELLFIRNVGQLQQAHRKQNAWDRWIGSSILGILSAIITGKALLLQTCFDTQWLTKVRFKVVKASAVGANDSIEILGGENDMAGGFEIIDNIDVERKRLTRFVREFSDKHRISAQEFWLMAQDALTKGSEDAFARVSEGFKRRTGIAIEPGILRIHAEQIQSAIDAGICKLDSSIVKFNRA